MPGEDTTQKGQDNNRDRILIRRALRTARRNLRLQRSIAAFPASFFLPLFAAAAWAAAARFTLADLPRWPEGLFFLGWLAVFVVQLARLRVTSAEAAAFLDKKLDLGERLTTLLEYEGRARVEGRSEQATPFMNYLTGDTAFILRQRLELLPHPFRVGSRWSLAACIVAVAVFAGVLLAPSSLDAVRSTQGIVKTTLEEEAQHLADLRAELVQRPDLPDSLKQSLDAQLAALEKSLRAAPTDRAEALAAIADAEEKVRGLVPASAASDFDPITHAAELFKDAASSTVDVGGNSIGETGDINTVQEALKRIKDNAGSLGSPQTRAMVANLERAASAAAGKDPELAKDLSDAADALRNKDLTKAAQSLDSAGKRFDAAEKAQQAAAAVESTLSKLEDGRQNIAKAGTDAAARRPQVGFRRGNGVQPSAQGSPTALVTDQAGTNNDAVMAQGPTGNGTALPSSGAGPAQPGSGSGTLPGGQGSSSGGQTGDGQGKPVAGQPASPGSGSGGGAGTGSQGSNLGRIVGPIKGSGGSSNSSGDAQGSGVSSGDTQSTQGLGGQSDQVYVPNRGDAPPQGSVGQAAPEPEANGVSGRPGDGASGDSKTAAPGIGTITTVHTPYTEVIGKYAQQATEALDRAYVPPDAKAYVRDYFSALGK